VFLSQGISGATPTFIEHDPNLINLTTLGIGAVQPAGVFTGLIYCLINPLPGKSNQAPKSGFADWERAITESRG
jgi:hypothetical protein